MKTRTVTPGQICLILLLVFNSTIVIGQEEQRSRKSKEIRIAEQHKAFEKVDSLVNSRQFVFEAVFASGSSEVFVVVDSSFAEVQNGNRNNLSGRITSFQIKKNLEKMTISVTMLMRGDISTADVFLFMGSSGEGTATIKSDFPGYFTFNGKIVDFSHAEIYEGRSHFIH
jgi:hypothetical protein